MKLRFWFVLFALVSVHGFSKTPLDLCAEFHCTMLPAQKNDEEACAWFTGLNHAFVNCVFRFSCEGDVADKVDEVLALAVPNTPISFWISPSTQAEGLEDILEKRGFQWFINCPAMKWETKPMPSPELEVRTADMRIYHEIFSVTAELSEDVASGYAKLLEKSGAENYLVYISGKPVGTGTLFIEGKMGHVAHIMIHPEYQRRGAGRAMMLHIMNRANTLGLEELSLESSPDGFHLYESLGFKKTYDINIYIRQ